MNHPLLEELDTDLLRVAHPARIRAAKLLADDLQLGPRARYRRARLEPRRDGQEVPLIRAVRIRLERKKQVGGRVGPIALGQHAYDDVRIAVDRNGASGDLRIAAEPGCPRVVRENDDVRAAGPILVGAEATTDQRLHGEDAEVIHADVDALDLLGPVAAAEIHAGAGEVVGGDPVERLGTAPGHELGNRRCAGCAVRILTADLNEPIRVRVRQRAQQHTVDDREDRGIRPNAQRQRHNHDQAEPRVPDNDPGPVPANRTSVCA